MIVYSILGIGSYSFADEKTGVVYEGKSFYVGYKSDNVDGYVCEKVNISNKKLGDMTFKTGDKIYILYNKYGKVEFLQLVK